MRKPKSKLRILRGPMTFLICLSLLSAQTRANESRRDDTIIKQGDPAPFDGVLVDDPSYRYYFNMTQVAKYYEKREKECEPCNPGSGLKEFLIWGLAGLALGSVTVIYLNNR